MAQGFWGTTSGRNSGGIKASPSSSSSSSSSAVKGSSFANSGGRKAKAGRKLSGAFSAGFYGATSHSNYSPKPSSTAATKSSVASSSGAPVAVSGFAAPRNVPAPAPAPAKH